MPRRRRPASARASTRESARQRLEAAAEGLLYASEADEPFAFVAFPAAERSDAPLTPQAFARLAGAPEARVEAMDLDTFLARHLDRSDPADAEARRQRPRWRRLATALRETLDDVRVYRVGEVEVGCYVVGWTADGVLAGLRTVAVET
ncbi:MAG TPA: nuclease A inhibitor family protein [Gemmatimonadaceae bacterium]|nr:nuclease A inhibitor family protein [Gemmatimonadaceae bacterium]